VSCEESITHSDYTKAESAAVSASAASSESEMENTENWRELWKIMGHNIRCPSQAPNLLLLSMQLPDFGLAPEGVQTSSLARPNTTSAADLHFLQSLLMGLRHRLHGRERLRRRRCPVTTP